MAGRSGALCSGAGRARDGCRSDTRDSGEWEGEVSTYVLVHGSWHGSWCWQKVTPRLEAAGHSVKAIDLPGHGGDGVKARDITLESYVQCVTDVLEELKERAILVGHSRGGVVISQAAEQRPEKIERLV